MIVKIITVLICGIIIIVWNAKICEENKDLRRFGTVYMVIITTLALIALILGEDKAHMENEIIKPCPFCGGEAEFSNSIHVTPMIDEDGAYVDYDTEEYYESVQCKECGAMIELYDVNNQVAEGTVIEMWNRRTCE